MRGFPDLPPIWTAAFAVAAIGLSNIMPILRIPRIEPLVWFLVCAGFGLIVWSAYFFLRKKTPIEPHHTPTSLIVEGPYRFTRNPIYLGFFLGLLGVALWSGGLSGLLVVLIFPVIITHRFIKGEEAALRAQFAEDADLYFSKTSRWLLGV